MQRKGTIVVSVLLTCYNRKEKTLKSLQSLFKSIDFYNDNNNGYVKANVFLTDDRCTDGTSEAVLNSLKNRNITIVRSEGNAYWAGGMRIAWKKAIESEPFSDFFLLINDDTIFKEDAICELFDTHRYSVNRYKKGGVYSGFISSTNNESIITYGAKKYCKHFFARAEVLHPTGVPQECVMVNGNCMLVCKNVVESIGILDDVFIHAAADMDYGFRATKNKIPVLVTSKVCGFCEFDHDSSEVEKKKVINMNIKERKEYLDRPNIKQYHDSLIFYWRYDKFRYILFKLSYYLNLYFPRCYYALYKTRNH